MPPIVMAIMGLLSGPLEKLIPDPNARNEFTMKMLTLFQSADLAQLEVNKAEAANSNMFVAGWRPFIGWVCGAALVYQYLGLPLGIFTASFFVSEDMMTKLLNAPKLDGNLWELLAGMLGLGAMRSFEKYKGVAR